MFSTFEEAVDFIMNIPKFTKKNEPEKTAFFLDRLGDISKTIPCIHVAGTNGKGSVTAFIKAGLNASGLSVGTFVSPHLVDIRERFTIDGRLITQKEFLNLANYISGEIISLHAEEGYSDYHPTFFEYLFFMAVVWFHSKRPDVIVFETGLGGRLDATNSISSPAVCIITEIGLDHMEYLGETKEQIALEKAGIIKRNVPVVFADRTESISSVIRDYAKSVEAPYYGVKSENIKNLERSCERIDFSIQSRYDELAFFTLNTRAQYQVENSLLAYEGICFLNEALKGRIDLAKVREGFADMTWPGRMEKVSSNLVLDGAHNEDGIRAFTESVAADNASSRSLVYSAVSDKQIETVAGIISDSGLFDNIYICRLESYRAADVERIRAAYAGREVICFDTVSDALRAMLADGSEMKYVVGSLYLVGEVKALIE